MIVICRRRARLLADKLLPDNTLAELADQQLAQRNAELDQQLFETKNSSAAPSRNPTPPAPSTAN